MTYTIFDEPPEKHDGLRPPKPGIIPYRPDDMGAYRNRRYQQIFEDHSEFGLGYAIPESDRHRPFDESFDDDLGAESGPYEDSIFLIHGNKRGIRVSIQAPRKIFFICLLIGIAILAKPGLLEAIQALLKSIQAMH